MAEAPADPGRKDHLEQKILQVLEKAGRPVKTSQLVKECGVLKKELNQVLYDMQGKGRIFQAAQATWCLSRADLGGPGPMEELAQPSLAQRPQQDEAVMAESPHPQLSDQCAKIYRFLEGKGPCKALQIAQGLGMRTASDVNPDLYKMKKLQLLSHDQHLNVWDVSRSEDSGRTTQSAMICQKNPINVILLSGPQSHISINNSKATQIGHGNIMTMTASGEGGPSAPHRLPPTAPGDASTQGPPTGAWGPQDIRVEQSTLRRVQLGHSNEMSLLSVPSEGPTFSLSGSSPVSTEAGGPDTSFEVRMSRPGPQHEGDGAQRVHIKRCFMEDTAIGNSNKMTISPGAVGSGDSRRDPEEPEKDTDPSSEGTGCRSDFPHDVAQAVSDSLSLLTAELRAMSLGNTEPDSAECCF